MVRGVGADQAVTKPPKQPRPVRKDKRPDQTMTSDIAEEHYRLIGEVVVTWARLEVTMERIIWGFLRLSEIDGRLITTRLDTGPKLQMLSHLADRYLLDGALKDRFVEALVRVGELVDDRNLIVHGVWGTLMPDDVPIVGSLRRKSPVGRATAETFSPERMNAIIDDTTVAHRVMVEVLHSVQSGRTIPPAVP